jgi:23S rRNA (cytosine1962-C5)-methyltransferase
MRSDWIDLGLVRDFAAEQTNAHRVCTKPQAWAERFDRDLLLSFKTEVERDRILAELPDWTTGTGLAFDRIFARFLPRKNAEREAPLLITGEPGAGPQATVTERGFHFGIDFSAGYSAGLFLDQRENRHFIQRTKPRHLLNCFAYTCSFSVVAAAGGAETLSIDLSKKSLARGRENFALNHLATEGQRFMADDVLEVMPRLARKGEKFDAIVLDPPTFSRSHRGRAFQVEHDFEKLLLAALEVADREAHILLSTNCTTLDERGLEVMARFCLKAARRAGSFQRSPALPDFPAGQGARTLWLSLR